MYFSAETLQAPVSVCITMEQVWQKLGTDVKRVGKGFPLKRVCKSADRNALVISSFLKDLDWWSSRERQGQISDNIQRLIKSLWVNGELIFKSQKRESVSAYMSVCHIL